MTALFTPLTVRKVNFRNRIVMPPMVNESGDEEGRITNAALHYYRERAAAGTAMIIVEATAVDEKGRCWRTGLGAYSERHTSSLQRLLSIGIGD